MDATVKPVTVKASDKKWAVMDRSEKTIFVLKLTLMLCSFGWIYGNVLAP